MKSLSIKQAKATTIQTCSRGLTLGLYVRLARSGGYLAQQIALSHHPESDNCEVMIKRVGETYSRTLHDHEAGCVDGGQFVEIGAPEIFPRPLQIAELARKDFQSAPSRHPLLPRQK